VLETNLVKKRGNRVDFSRALPLASRRFLFRGWGTNPTGGYIRGTTLIGWVLGGKIIPPHNKVGGEKPKARIDTIKPSVIYSACGSVAQW
jgi:hypothetical protein